MAQIDQRRGNSLVRLDGEYVTRADLAPLINAVLALSAGQQNVAKFLTDYYEIEDEESESGSGSTNA